MTMVVVDEQRAAVRAAFEAGCSVSECAAAGGVSKSTVFSWAKAEGWVRGERPLEARQAQTANARERKPIVWEERRAEEANEAGESAALARMVLEDCLIANNPFASRAAVAYGILIDKAQLLTGGATSRLALGGSDARDAALAVFDELAPRRAA